MHRSNKVHTSINNSNFVKNSDHDYQPTIGIRKERRTKFHSNFLNLKETIVLLFTILSIVLPIGIQPESQANTVFAQSNTPSINENSENDKSKISSSPSFSQSSSRSNSNKDPVGASANSGKDDRNIIIFDPASIDLPSPSSATNADSEAATQANNLNEKTVSIDESKNDWNSNGSIQPDYNAYDDSIDSSTSEKVSNNIILHDDKPGTELSSRGTQMNTVSSNVNNNTNGIVNDKVSVHENQSTIQSDSTTGSQSQEIAQSNDPKSTASSEPRYKSYRDYIDNSGKKDNIIKTDDKPGTELSATESLTGTVNSNINDNSNQKVNQTESIPKDGSTNQSDATKSSQFRVDNQSSNSNSTVSSQPLYKSYRDFIEHNKANKDGNNENGISSKSTTESMSATAADSQVTVQSSSEIYGDFNGDGFDDLAIGVPGEDVGPLSSTGAVEVIYGDNSGLDARVGDQFLTALSITGDPEIALPDDGFGSSLAAGDFNGDGRDDLAIGAPFVFSTETGETHPAVVYVVYGTALGLEGDEDPKADFQVLLQGVDNIDGIPDDGDGFGSSLTSGDFNGDGKDDLAIGVPNESVGTIEGAGGVEVIYGSSSGLSATSPRADQFWTQNSADIERGAEVGDSFGRSVTSGDFNNDGKDDLAIGVPDEALGVEKGNAGAVEVIYGSSSGLSATSPRLDQFWTQDSMNIDDVAEDNNAFGSSLTSGDFNGDGDDDLAIGIKWEDMSSKSGVGAVEVIYGSSSGLSATSPRADQFWTQDTTDINDVTESEDQFGYSLSSGDFNGDGKDDLAIGVWWEDLGSIDDAGGVEVIYGSSSGLSATSPRADQFWTQDSTDVNDVAESGDRFGKAVSSGDFNGDGKDDLAVGIPCEDVGTIGCGGGVEVIYGSSSDLSATSSRVDQFWTQDTLSVKDSTEDGDSFGDALG
jgi:hypothetical protein